jgi:predicted amidohydrolase YtcJ
MQEGSANPCTLVGGRIHTMDPSRPLASSIAWAEGRILAVDPPRPIGRVIDLRGQTALPGLIDAHLHLALGGETLLQLDLSTARHRADFERLVAERAATLPRDGWLIARSWNEDAFEERSTPDRTWLRAAGDRPAVAWRMDHHACVLNDAAIDLLAARQDLGVDPPGGRIERDGTGRPTGLFQEAAAWKLVNPMLPSPSLEERREAVRAAQRSLASLGLTSVGSMEYASVVRDAIEPLRAELAVRMRVTLLDRDWPLDLGYATGFANDERLAVIGMKAFIDGTLGSRTARMLEPYDDDRANRGLLVELAERGVLVDWIRHVRAAGLSPSMHAIGDEAARLALDAIDASDEPGAPPARVEHAQTLARADIIRFAGRFASMQPLHKAYDARSAATRLGPGRMDRFFPFRSLHHAGARLAFGSDWPIVSPDPILGLAAAITGLDVDGQPCRVEENLGVHAALAAYTSGAAACLNIDAGVLAAGKLADITVVDADPYACDWRTRRPRVTMTLMGGVVTGGVVTGGVVTGGVVTGGVAQDR